MSDDDALVHPGPSRASGGTGWRRTALVPALVVVVLGLVTATAVAVGRWHGRPDRAGSPIPGSMSTLSLHGVEVTVPMGWLGGACTWDRDVAFVGLGLHGCPAQPVPEGPSRFTTVVLSSTIGFGATNSPGRGVRRLPDGRTQNVVLVTDRAVRLVVTSPDPELAARITSTVHLVEDADGCPLRDSSDRPQRDAAASGPLVSERVTSGTVCAYDNGWVVASHRLTGAEAADLAATTNAAPAGFGPEGQLCGGGYDYLNGHLEPHWTAHLTGPGGDTRLWIYGHVCTPDAASNEQGQFSALTPELVDMLSHLALSPAGMPAATVDSGMPVELCRQAHRGGELVAAYATTVEQVRRWRIGPNLTPAAQPWAELPGAAGAAWCQTRTTTGYQVYAAGPDGATVTFATSDEPIDLGPTGPSIP